VTADSTQALIAEVVELERRDAAIARALEEVRRIEERAGAVRSRAGDIRDALERLPAEVDELAQRRTSAEAVEVALRSELELAEKRLASLESSRRRRVDELERARREAATARDSLSDAHAELERLAAAETALQARDASLRAEAGRLLEEAVEVAHDLRSVERIVDAARRAPGATLDELDDWGGQVRSALFVVRGTLETERERIVLEANALGSAVLGEPLGASSVAVVRRRVEQALRG
jgi:chromosome segregation protein